MHKKIGLNIRKFEKSVKFYSQLLYGTYLKYIQFFCKYFILHCLFCNVCFVISLLRIINS